MRVLLLLRCWEPVVGQLDVRLSPPPSPPHGWVMRNEDPPNKEVHASDLAHALSMLRRRGLRSARRSRSGGGRLGLGDACRLGVGALLWRHDLLVFQPAALEEIRNQITAVAPLNSFSPLPSMRDCGHVGDIES
jgi:hypothetical protein